MKSTSVKVKVMLLSAFVMVSPLLTFAGDRAVPPSGGDHAQDTTVIGRALQQGKGTGMSLSRMVIHANANREQTADEKSLVRAQPAAPRSNLTGTAFHK
jgi:hypothetical protein